VPVEVIVNGLPVQRRVIAADGALQDLTFDLPLERSSWVALRIFPSSHTNPVFVIVEGEANPRLPPQHRLVSQRRGAVLDQQESDLCRG
jgi:hypothetical protein